MAREFTAEALRDGVQAARERVQAEREMEQSMLAREIERGGRSAIEEQSTTGHTPEDGTDTVVAGAVGPGAGGDHVDEGTQGFTPAPEFEHNERTFEGDGRHPLDQQ